MPRKKEYLTDAYYFDFPERLRRLMTEQNKSQQEVAKTIGKTRQAVGYYADGSSSPDWKTLVKLAEFFNVSTDFILGLSDVPSVNQDIQDINRKTGLSQNAITRLTVDKMCDDFEKINFINHILSKDELTTFVKAINKRNYYIKKREIGILSTEKDDLEIDVAAVYKSYVESLLWNIVDDYKNLEAE